MLAQFGGSTPKGLHFVGVGYNLLEGNPEGGDQSNGGVDPGILFTRKVFKLTWDTNKESVDKQYKVPDQVSFAPRQSCVQTNQKEVFSGSKSYQEKLNVDASSNGEWNWRSLAHYKYTIFQPPSEHIVQVSAEYLPT